MTPGTFDTAFSTRGWQAAQLEGGYKSYRREVVAQLETLPRTLQYRVICGETGSAKSRLLEALDAQLLSVRINKVSGTTFYAQLVLRAADGSERLVDARPSDAIALAVRCGVKILAEDSVLEAASMLDFKGVREAEQAAEMAEFHDFVEHVSPEDFE